jgi:hypothetical protein
LRKESISPRLRRIPGQPVGRNKDAIERQLAHGERDKVRAAYNSAEHLPERRRMMQDWADYLEGLKAGARVTSIRKAAA